MKSIIGSDESLTLRIKSELSAICDGSKLLPQLFAAMQRHDIESLKLTYDSRPVRLGDLFEVIGDPSPNLVLEGDCSRIVQIGERMDRGTILVRGPAGTGLASNMQGGSVEVLGNCGDHLACNMRDGFVFVHGSAGDHVAGPAPGRQTGMRGGDCIVLGDVGDRAAERLRRGTLFVGGNAGDYGAAQIIAGTVIVLGEIGSHWAQGMKRGSIILSRPTNGAFSAELTTAREYELSFLPLIWRHLERLLGDNTIKLPSSRWATRQLGDRANQGLGEVLTLTRHSYS
ncbi:MAG: formylmethanofuran dehydrogenase subunit C [Pirellulaceae bacterium]|nr:formylmethanofuran dehydrogenase subunit C [Pirellulaceae bacterium]